MSNECYKHFMSLNISIRIHLSKDHSEYSNYFVKIFQQIYGCHLLHNIHSSLHLADDYIITYGPLDNCSYFPFENYMKILKFKLKKHEKPLDKLIEHYGEIIINDNITFRNRQYNTFTIKKPDCFVLTRVREIVQIIDILSNNLTVVGKKFNSKENLFEKPISFSKYLLLKTYLKVQKNGVYH